MEYKGKLYGRIKNKYFDTGKTSDDYDALEKKVIELENKVHQLSNRNFDFQSQNKCVAGCKYFTDSELKHHKDCPNYTDSMSEVLDDSISFDKRIHKIVDNLNLNALGEPSYRKDSNS
jgi:hypothetical protein